LNGGCGGTVVAGYRAGRGLPVALEAVMRRIRRFFPTVLVITAVAAWVAVAATVTSSACPLAAHSQPGVLYRA
jgi:predicted metal-binding membrane protein